MGALLWVSVFLGVGLVSTAAHAENKARERVTAAAKGTWVQEHEIPPTAAPKTSGTNYGADDLLLDQQVDLTHGYGRYVRRVSRVLTTAGAESLGKLQIEFTPAYESLVVHEIALRRNASKIVLAKAGSPLRDLRILDNNTLQEGTYDGSVTAVLILPDVRVGDLIDVSYTVRGQNPVFAGKYSSTHLLGTGRGVVDAFLRFHTLTHQHLEHQLLAGATAPKESTQGEIHDLEWHASDVPAPVDEEGTPSWHRTIPAVGCRGLRGASE